MVRLAGGVSGPGNAHGMEKGGDRLEVLNDELLTGKSLMAMDIQVVA